VEVDIERVTAASTFSLRQAVLRPHQSIEEVATPEDDDPETATFAAIDRATGAIVGTVTMLRQQAPMVCGEASFYGGPKPEHWRLRFMATREDARNQGIGAAVLDAALAHVAAEGAKDGLKTVLVWCQARERAVPFYQRAGFRTWGDKWVVPFTGPHVVMWRYVEPQANAGAGEVP